MMGDLIDLTEARKKRESEGTSLTEELLFKALELEAQLDALLMLDPLEVKQQLTALLSTPWTTPFFERWLEEQT